MCNIQSYVFMWNIQSYVFMGILQSYVLCEIYKVMFFMWNIQNYAMWILVHITWIFNIFFYIRHVFASIVY